MTPSYNEGVESALERLRAELESSNATTFVVPFSQNHHFTGRDSELAELEKVIFEDRSSTRLAIVGAGGTGKSQVAFEFAYRCKKEHSDYTIFWINAGNVDNLLQSYTTICQELEIPG